MQRVRTAGKLGYCFGVSQAIEKAVMYADENGPLYSLGTIAHNEHVVAYLLEHNVKPITVEEVSQGINVAITAHGAPPETYNMLKDLGCQILDCTCPIVRRAQAVVSQQLDNFDIVIFGDPEHQEVIGINGWAEGAKFIGNFNQLFKADQEYKELDLGKKVGVVSQTTKVPSDYADFITTLIHRLQWQPAEGTHRLEEFRVFNTICPIVATRVQETRNLAEDMDMMFVVGSQESANTKNLANVARPGVSSQRVYIVQDTDHLIEALSDWFVENEMAFPRVGVTAGTSTPIEIVSEVVTKLKELLYERENSNQRPGNE